MQTAVLVHLSSQVEEIKKQRTEGALVQQPEGVDESSLKERPHL